MKSLMIAAVVLVVLFFGLVSVPVFRNQSAQVNKIISSSSAPVASSAENNFSPYSGLNGLPNAFSGAAGSPSGISGQEKNSSPISQNSGGSSPKNNFPLSGIYENLPSPQTRQNISPAATSTAAQNILPLPVVADSEIKISPQGINNASDYIAYFNEHYKDVQFDTGRLDAVLKNQSGVFLLPSELVQKSLADNNFSETASSLETENDFISAIINYLKSIPVSSKVVPLHKQMIGFEELTQELIQKSLNQNGPANGADSQASLADLKSFYNGYLVTARYENGEIWQEVNAGSASGTGFLGGKNEFFGNLLRDFGLAKIAEAALTPTFPLGGKILTILPCNAGSLLTIGPPTPPLGGTLFVPPGFLLSPLAYLYKQMDISDWWLGLYSHFPVACAGTNYGTTNTIFMTGTSMFGPGIGVPINIAPAA